MKENDYRFFPNAGICTNANYRLVLRILLSHSVRELLQYNAREVRNVGTLGTEDSNDFYASDLRSTLALTGELDEVTTMRVTMCLQVSKRRFSLQCYCAHCR